MGKRNNTFAPGYQKGFCEYCRYWRGRKKGCSRNSCSYVNDMETDKHGRMDASDDMPDNVPDDASRKENLDIRDKAGQKEILEKQGDGKPDCRGCPYGRHAPCIGFCLAELMGRSQAGI